MVGGVGVLHQFGHSFLSHRIGGSMRKWVIPLVLAIVALVAVPKKATADSNSIVVKKQVQVSVLSAVDVQQVPDLVPLLTVAVDKALEKPEVMTVYEKKHGTDVGIYSTKTAARDGTTNPASIVTFAYYGRALAQQLTTAYFAVG